MTESSLRDTLITPPRAVALQEVGPEEVACLEAPSKSWYFIHASSLIGRRTHALVEGCQLYNVEIFRQEKVDPLWVAMNVGLLKPIALLLACGPAASLVFHDAGLDLTVAKRTIMLPRLDDRRWTSQTFAQAGRFIREGKQSLFLKLAGGRLVAEVLEPEPDIPF